MKRSSPGVTAPSPSPSSSQRIPQRFPIALLPELLRQGHSWDRCGMKNKGTGTNPALFSTGSTWRWDQGGRHSSPEPPLSSQITPKNKISGSEQPTDVEIVMNKEVSRAVPLKFSNPSLQNQLQEQNLMAFSGPRHILFSTNI